MTGIISRWLHRLFCHTLITCNVPVMWLISRIFYAKEHTSSGNTLRHEIQIDEAPQGYWSFSALSDCLSISIQFCPASFVRTDKRRTLCCHGSFYTLSQTRDYILESFNIRIYKRISDITALTEKKDGEERDYHVWRVFAHPNLSELSF